MMGFTRSGDTEFILSGMRQPAISFKLVRMDCEGML